MSCRGATHRLRFQPDSNWCERFCRPVPNHSDMEPCYVCREFVLFPFAVQNYELFLSCANIF